MSTKLRIIDAPTYGPGPHMPVVGHDGEPCRDHATDILLAGCMWRDPEMDADGLEAWAIVLPDGAGVWYTTERASGDHLRWDVTGEPPNITVTPSIDAHGSSDPGKTGWHGWIKNGELVP
jgi:hypothetical protein